MAIPIILKSGTLSGQGQPGISMHDIQLFETITFSDNEAANSGASYVWTLNNAPPFSSASLTGSATATPTLIVDKEGSYIITANVSGLTSSRVYSIPLSTTGERIPAFEETLHDNSASNDTGWHKAMYNYMTTVDTHLGNLKGEIWYPPSSPSIYDDEFTSDTVGSGSSNAWDFSGSVGLTSGTLPDFTASFSSGLTRYNIVRGTHLRFQCPADSKTKYFHKQLGGGELPNGLYWVRISSYYKFGNVTANDGSFGFGLFATNVDGPDSGNNIEIFANEPDTNLVGFQAQKVEASVVTAVQSSDMENVGIPYEYLAIIKKGSDFDCYIKGTGYWTHIETFNSYGGTAVDRVGFRGFNSATTDPGNVIFDVDFFRYSPSLVLP